jgi:cytoplasmic iron level regulating protein YaaA (DUF328/UPF0246 family)
MAPTVFEESQLKYVQEHLRILSGFYGVLKPMDGVTPYRLEMQAKADVNGRKSLYDFWIDKLYQACKDEDGISKDKVKSMIKEQMENQAIRGGKKY